MEKFIVDCFVVTFSVDLFSSFISAIIFGAMTIGLAYLASFLGKTALTISFGIFGIVGGPLLGLIMSGMFIPFMNSWVSFARLQQH